MNERDAQATRGKRSPNIIHVLGRPTHGKTTLVVELVRELVRRGLRVGTIKHSSHDHELDTPGKDSYRHRTAGASPAAIVTPGAAAVHLVANERENCSRLLLLFDDCDVILIEGHLDLPGPRVEVWRAAIGTPPLALEQRAISAVISDDPVNCAAPVWPRQDLRLLVDRLLALAERQSN
jgi:molybdopterin-guanine dinucleotide biosynthesis protein B